MPSKYTRIEQKWGFGMAPLKPETRQGRLDAALSVRDFILSNDAAGQRPLLINLSEVKGLFNRTVRQDQWDWFTTWTLLGCPASHQAEQIGKALGELRSAVAGQHAEDISALRKKLQNLGVATHLASFLEPENPDEDDGGFIYVLSTRELPDILKIGRTARAVETRVNEINGATGVIIPFGVRYAWRVKDPVVSEREIHTLLAEWRLRSDREAFHLEFFKAKGIIERYLRSKMQVVRRSNGRADALQTLNDLEGHAAVVQIFRTALASEHHPEQR